MNRGLKLLVFSFGWSRDFSVEVGIAKSVWRVTFWPFQPLTSYWPPLTPLSRPLVVHTCFQQESGGGQSALVPHLFAGNLRGVFFSNANEKKKLFWNFPFFRGRRFLSRNRSDAKHSAAVGGGGGGGGVQNVPWRESPAGEPPRHPDGRSLAPPLAKCRKEIFFFSFLIVMQKKKKILQKKTLKLLCLEVPLSPPCCGSQNDGRCKKETFSARCWFSRLFPRFRRIFRVREFLCPAFLCFVSAPPPPSLYKGLYIKQTNKKKTCLSP